MEGTISTNNDAVAPNIRRNHRRISLPMVVRGVVGSRSLFFILTVAALVVGGISVVTGYFFQVRPRLSDAAMLDFLSQMWVGRPHVLLLIACRAMAFQGFFEPLEVERSSRIIGDFLWNQSLIVLVLLIPAFVVAALRWRKAASLTAVVLLFGLVTTAALGAEVAKNWESSTVSYIGEEPSVAAYLVKLVLMVVALFSPALVFAYYRMIPTMDRYTLRSFASPFILCLLGFIAIAFLIDLTDNFADFANSKSSMKIVLSYYGILLPQIIVLFAPIALLLSLLYTLGKMSRANEIISMLGTGRSLLSILKPVFFVGIMASLICMALSYYWAPRSVGATEAMIESIHLNEEPDSMATRQPYVNASASRAWYVGRIPFDLTVDKMRGIEVYGTDEEGRLEKVWLAKSAWWWMGGAWTLYNGHVIEFDEDEVATSITSFDGDGSEGSPNRLDVDWDETPWQIIGQTFRADFLSVPDLGSYIRSNATPDNAEEMAPFRTYWHYNLSLPWTCFVVVLIAAPLGIVYSRRGILGGVAVAILIFFGIMVLDNFFLNLGKFNSISPAYAAWMPRIIFGGIGFCILMFRARNRELPKLNPFLWYRNYRATHAG